MTRRDGIYRFFIGSLVALLSINVFNLVRNEDAHPHQVMADTTLEVARSSPKWSVKGGFAVYQDLRQYLQDRRLTIPSELTQLTWSLEAISRAHVNVTTDPLVLTAKTRPLRRRATSAMILAVGKKREELYVFAAKKRADEYVMVRATGDNSLMLMPASMYRELQPTR